MTARHAQTPDDARPGQADQPVEIRVEDLHRAFGDLKVLRGVNLDIHRGEIVAVVGGSGSGKTVLLEHITGQLEPDRGRVLVADHSRPGAPLVDLAGLSEQELDAIRKQWAVVFQRNALFSGSVYDNIALWHREVMLRDDAEIRPLAVRALEAVGLDADEVWDKDRDELSGGMAKRVAVARALSMAPRLMFYDEPTTGLDPDHARMIDELIDRTHREGQMLPVPRTTMIITHDKDLLYRLEPRVVMLHDGRVFFQGSYRDFRRSDSSIIKPYFDLMPALQQRRVG